MEEQTSGKYSGYVSQTDDVAEPEENKTAEGAAQSDEMTAEEIEERLKQMLERGEIGMSQYNLARQDLLKYGARFEDMPYLFVGKELPLDLTKESRKWYNARLPRDEAVKLLKNPNITAMKMKAIREHYQLLPDEEMLLAGILVVIRGLINLSTALTSTDNPSLRNSLLDVACGLIMYNIVLVLNLTGLSY